jgi:hypothetical protein
MQYGFMTEGGGGAPLERIRVPRVMKAKARRWGMNLGGRSEGDDKKMSEFFWAGSF